MKVEGKIVIACTHDDHCFDVADKIIKMDMGEVDNIFYKKDTFIGTKINNPMMKEQGLGK